MSTTARSTKAAWARGQTRRDPERGNDAAAPGTAATFWDVPRCLESGHKLVEQAGYVYCTGCPRWFELHGTVRVVMPPRKVAQRAGVTP